MSQTFYLLLHLLGLVLLIAGLAGVSIHAANGGTKSGSNTRGLTAAMHGLGAFLLLLGGFGMLAKMGIMSDLPGWVWAKLVIWLLLGGAIVLPYRKPRSARLALGLVLLLVAAAAWLALYKPF